MQSHSQKFRLGIFIIAGTFAILILLFIIGSEQFLKEKDIYFIGYENLSVSGLEVGSPVKYLGISVGTIDDIHIDPTDVSRVIVSIALEPGTPVKRDARAEIAAIGITGLKMIEIRGGSQQAEILDPGEYIRPGGSITEEITGKAEVIAEKIELVVNNLNKFTQPENLNKIIKFTESATETFENLNTMLIENRKDFRNTVHLASSAMTRLDTISNLLQASIEEIHFITTSDTLKQIVENVREITVGLKKANLVSLIDQLGELVERTNKLLVSIDHDMSRGSIDFLSGIQRLKSALEYLDETSRMINEDPSILLRGTSTEEIPDEELDR